MHTHALSCAAVVESTHQQYVERVVCLSTILFVYVAPLLLSFLLGGWPTRVRMGDPTARRTLRGSATAHV